jgi:hypothetical protein
MHQMTALLPEQAQQLSFHLTPVCKDWWDASLSVTVSEPGKTPSYLCINDSTIAPDVHPSELQFRPLMSCRLSSPSLLIANSLSL